MSKSKGAWVLVLVQFSVSPKTAQVLFGATPVCVC